MREKKSDVSLRVARLRRAGLRLQEAKVLRDREVARAVSEGNLSLVEIGRAVGLSNVHVRRIAQKEESNGT